MSEHLNAEGKLHSRWWHPASIRLRSVRCMCFDIDSAFSGPQTDPTRRGGRRLGVKGTLTDEVLGPGSQSPRFPRYAADAGSGGIPGSDGELDFFRQAADAGPPGSFGDGQQTQQRRVAIPSAPDQTGAIARSEQVTRTRHRLRTST